jgi:hypothetical protein
VTLDGGFHALQFVQPAGGAYYDVHSQRGDALHVFGDGGGNGEIHGYVDALEVGGRHAFESGVVEFVELQRHGRNRIPARTAR